jgi:hypothetical protein
MMMARIKLGAKVIPDAATVNQSNARIGDFAPTFVHAGDKVVRDIATANPGKVRVGDFAPVFTR